MINVSEYDIFWGNNNFCWDLKVCLNIVRKVINIWNICKYF